MAYTTIPLSDEFGDTLTWQYQQTGLGTPSSFSGKPENASNSNLLITAITVVYTGASTWDMLPAGTEQFNIVPSWSVYVNPPDESERFNYQAPDLAGTSQYGFASTLKTEILLRPEYGLVFTTASLVDSSGSDNLAIYYKLRGTRVDPSTTTPFLSS